MNNDYSNLHKLVTMYLEGEVNSYEVHQDEHVVCVSVEYRGSTIKSIKELNPFAEPDVDVQSQAANACATQILYKINKCKRGIVDIATKCKAADMSYTMYVDYLTQAVHPEYLLMMGLTEEDYNKV